MRHIIFSLLFCFFSFSLFAETIELKNGKVVQGRILIRDQNSIYLETATGTTNINKSDIRAIDGKDYQIPAGAARLHEPEASQIPEVPSAVPEKHEMVSEEAPLDQTTREQEPPPMSVKQESNLTVLQVMKAVPFINVKAVARDKEGKEIEEEWLGSGAIINSNGTLLTNAHVVEDSKGARRIKSIEVTLYEEKDIGQRSKRKYEARVIKTHPVYDLALIDIHAETPDYLRFANESDIKVGEEVRACGNPQGFDVSFSKGIISGIRTNRQIYTSSKEKLQAWLWQLLDLISMDENERNRIALEIGGGKEDELLKLLVKLLRRVSIGEREYDAITWIQTDAAINPGNSGGPLLGSDNRIVGMNTWIVTSSGGSQGLGFALHVKHLKKFAAGYHKE